MGAVQQQEALVLPGRWGPCPQPSLSVPCGGLACHAIDATVLPTGAEVGEAVVLVGRHAQAGRGCMCLWWVCAEELLMKVCGFARIGRWRKGLEWTGKVRNFDGLADLQPVPMPSRTCRCVSRQPKERPTSAEVKTCLQEMMASVTGYV